jgi:hypothetical protein
LVSEIVDAYARWDADNAATRPGPQSRNQQNRRRAGR